MSGESHCLQWPWRSCLIPCPSFYVPRALCLVSYPLSVMPHSMSLMLRSMSVVPRHSCLVPYPSLHVPCPLFRIPRASCLLPYHASLDVSLFPHPHHASQHSAPPIIVRRFVEETRLGKYFKAIAMPAGVCICVSRYGTLGLQHGHNLIKSLSNVPIILYF